MAKKPCDGCWIWAIAPASFRTSRKWSSCKRFSAASGYSWTIIPAGGLIYVASHHCSSVRDRRAAAECSLSGGSLRRETPSGRSISSAQFADAQSVAAGNDEQQHLLPDSQLPFPAPGRQRASACRNYDLHAIAHPGAKASVAGGWFVCPARIQRRAGANAVVSRVAAPFGCRSGLHLSG